MSNTTDSNNNTAIIEPFDGSADIRYSRPVCSDCGKDDNIVLDKERGELTCRNDGLVIQDRIVDETQVVTVRDEKLGRKVSVCCPISLTQMLPRSNLIEIRGFKDDKIKNSIRRATRLGWSDRHLLIASNELTRVATLLTLGKEATDKSRNLYIKAHRAKLIRGRSISGMVAACLYVAMRKFKLPRSLAELVDFSGERSDDIRRYARVIMTELKETLGSVNPVSLVPRFRKELGFPMKAEVIAVKLISAADSIMLQGKAPNGLAGAALYEAGVRLDAEGVGQKRSQNEVAEAVGVTEVTLRSMRDLLTGATR